MLTSAESALNCVTTPNPSLAPIRPRKQRQHHIHSNGILRLASLFPSSDSFASAIGWMRQRLSLGMRIIHPAKFLRLEKIFAAHSFHRHHTVHYALHI